MIASAGAECSFGETARRDSRVLADKEVVVNAPTLIRREFCRTGAHGRGEARRGEPAEERAAVYTNTLGCVNLDAGRTVPRQGRRPAKPNRPASRGSLRHPRGDLKLGELNDRAGASSKRPLRSIRQFQLSSPDRWQRIDQSFYGMKQLNFSGDWCRLSLIRETAGKLVV